MLFFLIVYLLKQQIEIVNNYKKGMVVGYNLFNTIINRALCGEVKTQLFTITVRKNSKRWTLNTIL